MFEIAINYADKRGTPQETELKDEFIARFNRVETQHGVRINLTMGLFWIRPYVYMSLDDKNSSYLSKKCQKYTTVLDNGHVDADKYLKNCEKVRKWLGTISMKNFIDLSIESYKERIKWTKSFQKTLVL